MDVPVSKEIYHRVQQKAFIINVMRTAHPVRIILHDFIKIMFLKSTNYEDSH
jgi:hypothetical protein